MKVHFLFCPQRVFKLLVRFLSLLLTVILLSCRTVSYTIPHPVKMDLDKIKILSASLLAQIESKTPTQPDENTITLESNSNNKMSAEVLIAYRRDGMNILEDIQLGKVIEHKIIVKNSRGEVLAREQIDLENIKAIEFLNQTLELDSRKNLAVGDFLSIHLELTYVNPYIDIGCENSNISCEKLNSLLRTGNEDSGKEPVESARSKIQSKIDMVNKDLSPLLMQSPGVSVTITPPMNLGDINVVNYREWKLISSPTYFKILAILKNGKQAEDGKAEVFELPDLPTAIEGEKEKVKTFEIEKEKAPLKTAPSKRRKKTIYLP